MVLKATLLTALGWLLRGSLAAPTNVTVHDVNDLGSELTPDAHGTTYFTAEGYSSKDCTGKKYWAYEVSWGTPRSCLSEKQEIASVWVRHYGECGDKKVRIQQYSQVNVCNDKEWSTQRTSRGKCLTLRNKGRGAWYIRLECEGRMGSAFTF
ncbi:hypothetical protein VFPPC_06411 [Pochonia chlamydosporia 170]|uniref:Uncharacterized protein n=1 Tax=Pochonia chlamydosporia 170 TaxID=1380566 RepID=A0A179FIC6_METCM|nr:hypothetical protein VFPPC_06411 [Pochonia chlamydosporia 170]OAQ65282.1 hypothetical protein VFPPC_06411 [Pochonia chlamydosporia 170]